MSKRTDLIIDGGQCLFRQIYKQPQVCNANWKAAETKVFS